MQAFVIANVAAIPFRKTTHHARGTIILLNGYGSAHTEWDDIIPSEIFREHMLPAWPEGGRFAAQVKPGRLGFQAALADHQSTFAFTPFEYYATASAESKARFPELMPNKYFYDIEQMVFTMKQLIELHALKPPFTLVGFSEGGWRALLFQQRIPKVARVVLIDPQRFGLHTPENVRTCAARGPTQEDKLAHLKCTNFVRKFALTRCSSPVSVFLNVAAVGDADYTARFLSEVEFIAAIRRTRKATFHVTFDAMHALHFIHFDRIVRAALQPRARKKASGC